MAAGLPFVASNFPELRSIIESYHLGRTFDPDDPKDIAKAINDVLSDSGRYEQMKRNAIEAAKIFNWENESKKLLAFYRSLGKERNRDA
jgi:glycosyltransferase involved in cell wall biosynthesis